MQRQIDLLTLVCWHVHIQTNHLFMTLPASLLSIDDAWTTLVPDSASMQDALDSGWKPHMERS